MFDYINKMFNSTRNLIRFSETTHWIGYNLITISMTTMNFYEYNLKKNTAEVIIWLYQLFLKNNKKSRTWPVCFEYKIEKEKNLLSI